MKKYIVLCCIFSFASLFSQTDKVFTQQDSIRGSITPERAWWDLKKYDLKIRVNPTKRFISGTNTVFYEVLTGATCMQIDLQAPMQLIGVTQDGKTLNFKRNGNAFYIYLEKAQIPGAMETIELSFEGFPKVAKKAPWDGGFTWQKDKDGIDFFATSCQGEGASIWWPCKDHLYDEPENGMELFYTVPDHLTAVGNGRLIQVIDHSSEKTKTYHWRVTNPINNYGVSLAAGNYTRFSENYEGASGTLNCTYYVLKDNLSKAKEQFKEVARTLEALEYWFGPYPFYEDGYKLVETPFLGMEHQSSVSYGNGYKNGYKGYDLSGTDWGLKFDFIIVHETGHEWFGNNITNKDIADMWIHESFTNYSESLFLEYHFGKKAGDTYNVGLRRNILNDIPIIGHYDVNDEGSSDMYYKGANMLQTIREIMDNDTDWRKLLRGLNTTFRHKVVTSKEVQKYIQSYADVDLSPIFYQYLCTTTIPNLNYQIKNKVLYFRWENCYEDFKMPVAIYINDKLHRITPTTNWQHFNSKKKIKNIRVAKNYYVTAEQSANK